MATAIDQLNVALAGRFAIQRELGAGGMATVYLAEDLRHHRSVAIKVLSPEVASVIGRERFVREIEVAARLTHPHILALHESGAAGDLLFYVMPYVEGESLRDRLEREKQLPLGDAIRIAREVADALDYAHRHGVVHRDIKPGNILLVEQHAVVADFGIARAIAAAGGETLTASGLAIGTPAYASPEQVAGNSNLDGRSDIYSLGCVLYEMLAGQPPFSGPTAESLSHQHLSVAPRLVTEVRPTVPAEVAQAIQRSLAKAAADRFRTASEFAAALSAGTGPETSKRVTPASGRARRPMIAAAIMAIIALALVVWRFGPFLHAGRSPDVGKKAWVLVADFDGPAADSSSVAATRDLVMAALEQSEIVATVPRDQIRLALQMAGKPVSTRVDAELARELAFRSAVQTVLEGHVGRLGRGYSIVLRLVDADSARVVLSLSDAARDEDELIPTVGRISKRLRAELGERRSAIQATHDLGLTLTPSFEAYRAASRARDLLLGNESRAAIEVFRSALALDPDFAGAWGTLGFCYSNLGEPDSALADFQQALARPERLTDYQRLGFAAASASVSGDLSGALSNMERLVHLHPERSVAHNNRSAYLFQAGRFGEALESARTAEKVSPFGPVQQVLLNQFTDLLALGRVDEARSILPRFRGPAALEAPMQVAAAAGQWSAAESLATALRSSPSVDDDLRRTAATVLAAAQASQGRMRAADQTLRQAQSVAETSPERWRANGIRWDRLRLTLYSQGVAADPGSWDSSTAGLVARGAWSAASGDTTLARRLLPTIRARSALDLARQGFFGPTMVEGWIAARTGRWQEVLRLLGPAALEGEARGYVVAQSAPLVRWLVAEAYERLGRPDSAAAYFERAIAPPPEGGADLAQTRMAFSFAHRRLVLLYARMGRLVEARRHWDIFSRTFTRPDPELAPLVEEARAAMSSAQNASGRASRAR